MKTKTLYIIIFVLAVIIVLTMIYSKSKISELNPPIITESQVEVRQPEAVTQSTEPVFFSKQAITIIKPAQQKQQAAFETDKIKDLQYPQGSNYSSGENPVASGSANSQDTAGVAAGVTKSGKYPTKEEVKEMNSKGIVSY